MKLPSMIKGWLNTTQTPDEAFALFLASGNRKHLETVVHAFNQPLYHYLLTQSDEHLAKDVLQSTWLKVLSHQPKKEKSYAVRNWLFTIARHSLIDELRRLQRWQWQELDEHMCATEESLAITSEESSLAAFNTTLQQLPFHQKEAFVLQQEGFTLAEIAMITNDPMETIKSRIRYAKRTLKNRLERINE